MAQTCKNGKNTILVIEKDAHTAYLLDYMLSREGYKVSQHHQLRVRKPYDAADDRAFRDLP